MIKKLVFSTFAICFFAVAVDACHAQKISGVTLTLNAQKQLTISGGILRTLPPAGTPIFARTFKKGSGAAYEDENVFSSTVGGAVRKFSLGPGVKAYGSPKQTFRLKIWYVDANGDEVPFDASFKIINGVPQIVSG